MVAFAARVAAVTGVVRLRTDVDEAWVPGLRARDRAGVAPEVGRPASTSIVRDVVGMFRAGIDSVYLDDDDFAALVQRFHAAGAIPFDEIQRFLAAGFVLLGGHGLVARFDWAAGAA